MYTDLYLGTGDNRRQTSIVVSLISFAITMAEFSFEAIVWKYVPSIATKQVGTYVCKIYIVTLRIFNTNLLWIYEVAPLYSNFLSV